MRERENYREALDEVLKQSGGKHMIRLALASQILGLDKRTIKKYMRCEKTGRNYYVSAEMIARRLG